jgi:hypothetical protein
MSKSSANGMNAPSARTNVSAGPQRGSIYVWGLEKHMHHREHKIKGIM